jgi:hypothetical protein
MAEVLTDRTRTAEERGGAAIGLYMVADEEGVHELIEELYEEGGVARAKALEAMWRSLWKPFAKYFQHLGDADQEIVRHSMRGVGVFGLKEYCDKLEGFFENDDLREDALFAYAMAMPGETSRGRVKGMLRKIDALAELSPDETQTVMFALDERLRIKGLKPVFEGEDYSM